MTVEAHDHAYVPGVSGVQVIRENKNQYHDLTMFRPKANPSTHLKYFPEEINLGGSSQEGHGTVPDQGYVDPLMGGGIYRHKIAHQPVPQFFSGSGGGMPENLGYRFTRPTPNELHRGNPLEGIRPPRPPHL